LEAVVNLGEVWWLEARARIGRSSLSSSSSSSCMDDREMDLFAPRCRREMETRPWRQRSRAFPAFPARRGRPVSTYEEDERKKLALSLHRVYMLAHTASNRVRALDSLLFFSFTLI